MFGYFIEVTNTNSHLVPDDYQRRQTLAGAERYVTPSLKEYEERVLTAAERVEERERELFEGLRVADLPPRSLDFRESRRSSPSSMSWPRWPRRRRERATSGRS